MDQTQGVLAQAERLARLPTELIKAKRTNGEIVDALFTAALARLPAEPERAFAAKQFQFGKERQEICRDLLWVLVNTNEFMQLHSLRVGSDLTVQFHEVLTKAWTK